MKSLPWQQEEKNTKNVEELKKADDLSEIDNIGSGKEGLLGI